MDGPVTSSAFRTLASERLSDTVPTVGADTFAQVASWAVWAPETAGGTAWSRDLSVLSYDVLAPVIHHRVVFVALNKGTNPVTESVADWSNFHTGRSDYKLARATAPHEILRGAYITDFFKGLPTPDGASLRRLLRSRSPRERRSIVEAMVTLLRRELEILGNPDPLLVALGAEARAWLDEAPHGCQTTGVTHYSAPVAREAYARELAAVAGLALKKDG